MVAPRALIVVAAVLAIAACTSASAPSNDSPIAVDAGAPEAPLESSAPPRKILPYPAGPYGSAIGDVLADFHVIGYATSREHRDIHSLPFRDITLGEVRSDPKCTCLVISWSTAGLTCVPSIEGRNAVAGAVSSDESLCAVDVIWDTLDSGPPHIDGDSIRPPPPTRADLEAVCDGLYPPFPVGLATDEAVQSLGANPIPGLPDFYVLRTADMRIADVVYGADFELATRIHRVCASPRPGVETLATGLAPTALLLDDTHAFMADAKGRIERVARAGGAVEVLTETPAPPDTLAIDGAKVYWSESTTLAATSKSGGGRTVLATLASPATSIATDGIHVYLAHVDGSIGAVPVAGGSENVLVTGEAGPKSILVDDTQIYWLVNETNEVVRAAKDGTARVTLIGKDKQKRGQIFFTGNLLVARDEQPPGEVTANQFVAVSKSGTDMDIYGPDYGLMTRASWDAVAGRIDIVIRGGDRTRGDDAAIQSFSTTPRAFDGRRFPDFVTLGQHQVTDLASGGDGYVYWTTNEPSGGSLRRIAR